MGQSSGKQKQRHHNPHAAQRDQFAGVRPVAPQAPPRATALAPVGDAEPVVPPFAGSAQSIKVSLKQLNGRRDEIQIAADANVAELKRCAEKATDIPQQQQKMVFGGRLLSDTDQLNTFGINDGASIMLVMRLPKGTARPPLQDMLDTYEITIAQEDDLGALKRFDIVFLADDSGSMNHTETTSGVTQTRWKELQSTMSALIDFASYFDADGTDIYFLNRAGLEGVMDGKDPRIKQCFDQRPRGTTPLASRLHWIVESRQDKAKPLLIIMATDGEPDEGVAATVATVRHILTLPGREVRLGIMACTQDDGAVAWLNNLDDDPVVGNKVDVCDDYEAEKKEVLRKRPRFMLSDYYMKAMLGPVLAKYDQMD